MVARFALISAALATIAAGHGLVPNFTTDGVFNEGFHLEFYYKRIQNKPVPDIAAWYTENVDSGFVEPKKFGHPDIICHKNAIPGTLSATVAAGGTVDFQWGPEKWPHDLGPVITYVAKCPGECTHVDKTTLKFVKIEAVGIDANQKWGSQLLISQGGKWSTKVPASLAAGNYVFRHELISMHGAGSDNGAQSYPQCFNIAITGSGTANPEGTLGTELYKATDPGIKFNPYTKILDYPMPGPELFTG